MLRVLIERISVAFRKHCDSDLLIMSQILILSEKTIIRNIYIQYTHLR